MVISSDGEEYGENDNGEGWSSETTSLTSSPQSKLPAAEWSFGDRDILVVVVGGWPKLKGAYSGSGFDLGLLL